MKARLTLLAVLAAALGGIMLGFPTAYSGEPELSKIYISFGGDRDEFVVYPREIKLEAGNLYRFVIINPSESDHLIAAPEFSATVMTTELRKTPTGSALPAESLRSGILLRPAQMVEWDFMPTKEGSYKLGCEDREHAAAGMHTMIRVVL